MVIFSIELKTADFELESKIGRNMLDEQMFFFFKLNIILFKQLLKYKI